MSCSWYHNSSNNNNNQKCINRRDCVSSGDSKLRLVKYQRLGYCRNGSSSVLAQENHRTMLGNLAQESILVQQQVSLINGWEEEVAKSLGVEDLGEIINDTNDLGGGVGAKSSHKRGISMMRGELSMRSVFEKGKRTIIIKMMMIL